MLGNAISMGSARARIEPWWPAGARYAADFTRGLYMRDGQLVPASQAFSFTRASSKLARGADGSWTSFGVNVPCITARGILLEPERQNTALNSTGFDQWGLVRAAVTPNGRQGIDGGLSADLITATTSNANGAFASASNQTMTPGAPYTFSMVVERASSDWVALMFTTGDLAHRQTAWFNLATGAPGSTIGVGSEIGLVGAPTMEATGPGQYRIALTASASALVVPQLRLYLCDGNGALAVTTGCSVWSAHGQIEMGNAATSPILSGGRAADQLGLALPSGLGALAIAYEGMAVETISLPGDTYEVTPDLGRRLQRCWGT